MSQHNDWERVFSTPLAHMATFIEDLLTQQDLYPVVINKKDSNYLFGFFEIYVKPEFKEQATTLIENETDSK